MFGNVIEKFLIIYFSIAVVLGLLFTSYLGKRLQFWFQFHFTGAAAVLYWIAICLAIYSLDVLAISAVLVIFIFDLIYLGSVEHCKPTQKSKMVFIICTLLLNIILSISPIIFPRIGYFMDSNFMIFGSLLLNPLHFLLILFFNF